MKQVYEHRDELMPERTLIVEGDDLHVRVACDSPGIASVSHILTFAEARELAAALIEATA